MTTTGERSNVQRLRDEESQKDRTLALRAQDFADGAANSFDLSPQDMALASIALSLAILARQAAFVGIGVEVVIAS